MEFSLLRPTFYGTKHFEADFQCNSDFCGQLSMEFSILRLTSYAIQNFEADFLKNSAF